MRQEQTGGTLGTEEKGVWGPFTQGCGADLNTVLKDTARSPGTQLTPGISRRTGSHLCARGGAAAADSQVDKNTNGNTPALAPC